MAILNETSKLLTYSPSLPCHIYSSQKMGKKVSRFNIIILPTHKAKRQEITILLFKEVDKLFYPSDSKI